MLSFDDCYDDGCDGTIGLIPGAAATISFTNTSEDSHTASESSDWRRRAAAGTLPALPHPRPERLDPLLRADQAGPPLLELTRGTQPRISIGPLANAEVESAVEIGKGR
jgi:hypothetical protein